LEYVRGAALYLTVSLYEGLPLSVIEAMALNKCIIASDVPGNKDCVSDGENGYLFPLNSSLFADGIIELLENTDKRIRFEKNSRKLYESSFQIETRISELTCIYKSIAEGSDI
jgi:glycosyltransferase involved in cell wall biosynthesis